MTGRIRLRYSTTLNYMSMLLKIAVSLAFTVVVARKLTVKEYGLWGVILSLSAVMLSPLSFWDFWAARWHARGREEASVTGLLVTLIYALIAGLMIITIGYISPRLFGLNSAMFFLIAAPIATLTCIQAYMLSLSRVVRPELLGYTNILYDLLRLVLVLFFLIIFKIGLLGVIAAIELSLLVSDIYLAHALSSHGTFKGSINLGMITEWARLSPIPAFNMTVSGLRGGIRAFLAYLTGSPLEVSYLNVSITVETPFLRASVAATPALYAKLLKGRGSRGDLGESLSIIALFSGFIASLLLAAPKGVLGLFGHNYEAANIILQLVTVYAVLQGFSNIFETSLLGFEKADREGGVSFSSLAKSFLIKVPAAKFLSYIFVYGVALIAALLEKEPYMVLLVLAVALAASRVPLLAWMYSSTRKVLGFKPPKDPIIPVFISSIIVSMYFIFAGVNVVYSHTLVLQLLFLVWHSIIGLAIYLITMYTLSKWFRVFIRSAISYVIST